MQYYPTQEHSAAAGAVVAELSRWPEIEAVVLTCSCARGKAVRGSCVDFVALFDKSLSAEARASLKCRWEEWSSGCEAIGELAKLGPYAHVDMEFTDGDFKPIVRDWWCGDPDSFELEIGNTYAHTVPLYERGDYFRRMRDQWLPYYDDDLRRERLATTRKFCLNNLDHIPMFVERRLYFQSFKRLYDASREFLQALFIARRAYPIAYDKWIREQLVDILHLPDVYREMVALFEYREFESDEHVAKADVVRHLLDEYATE